jgi:hypothetical protein
MALFKDLKQLNERLRLLQSYNPSYPLGKWIVDIRIQNTRYKINKILAEIRRRNGNK